MVRAPTRNNTSTIRPTSHINCRTFLGAVVVVVGAGLEVVGLEVVALGLDDAGAPGCTEDPASKTDPLAATQEWRSPPTPRPESAILGNFYQCNPVSADLVVADSGNWLLHGIVTDGQKLAGMVGNKYAQVSLGVPTPVRWRCCSTSPLTCQHRPGFADVTYYTAPSGAGVFSAGTQWWICGVDPGCTKPGVDAPAVVRTISAITTRLLDAYAQGPAGGQHPAVDNLQQLHIPGASAPIPAALPNALVPN